MIRITIALTILTGAFTAAATEPDAPAREATVPGTESERVAALEAQRPAMPEESRVLRLRPEGDRSERAADREPAENAAIMAAASGAVSPFGISPVVPRVATGLMLGGYDSAAAAFRARGATEGRLLSFLAARVEYERGPGNGPSDRLSIGLRATFLNQAAHGVNLGAVAFYQPRDFRGEGDVTAGLLLSRRFDRLTLVLSPLVGSDPEGDDQNFELRLSGFYKAGSFLVLGLDSHGRYDLSEDEKRAGHSIIDWEAQAGVVAALGFGPLLLSTLVGPSVLARSDVGLDGGLGERRVRAGLLAMAGAGASF